MATCADLCKDAMVEAGALVYGQTPSAERLEYARTTLNRLMERWSNETVWVDGVDYVVTSLTSATSYSVGSGQTINIVTPAEIRGAALLNGEDRTPLEALSGPEWQALGQRYGAGTPTRYYYQRDTPGRLYLVDYPQSSVTLELMVPGRLQSFASTGDTLIASAGYQDAITQLLAVALCPALQRVVTPDLAERARRAAGTLQRINCRSPRVSGDVIKSSSGVWA